uniref:hypothetical protein n=1 Tax=uncultured Polaribacter sp. TaxID=174711 RepID=UPI0026144919|nr:hypothetical protein [uncultured Polaribacter sp.]
MIKKIFENIDKTKFNIVFTLIVMIISLIIGQLPKLPDSIGFGGFIPIIMPPIYSLITILFYFILKIFFKKGVWIVTLIGALYNLYEAFDWYFYYKNYK